MEKDIESERFEFFPDNNYYRNFLENSYKEAKRTVYSHRGSSYDLPAFSFLHLPKIEQFDTAHDLAIKAKQKGLKLIYEIGFGTSLSPLDSAMAEKNSLVMGFDPNGRFPEKITAGTENVNFPKDVSYSMATLFSLDAADLIKKNFPKAHRVQCISPYPTMVSSMISIGTKLSNNVDILPNPNMVDPKEFENIIKNLPPNQNGEVVYLNKQELEEILGTSKSSYIFPSTQEKVPLIRVSVMS